MAPILDIKNEISPVQIQISSGIIFGFVLVISIIGYLLRRRQKQETICLMPKNLDQGSISKSVVSVSQDESDCRAKRVRTSHRLLRFSLRSRGLPHPKFFKMTKLDRRVFAAAIKKIYCPPRFGKNISNGGYMTYRAMKVFLRYLTLRPLLYRNNKRSHNRKVSLYRKLPFRALSRAWGKINSVDLPTWLRSPALNLYIWMFGCKIEEAAVQDLQFYKNLGEFFRRPLKPDVRPVDCNHCLTSPADGRILHFGRVENGQVEQVKGVTYAINGFLGPNNWDNNNRSTNQDPADYETSLKLSEENDIFHCVIYLAPGDYHRFHSPTEWNINYRRHFPGELLSVSPGIARWVQGLFNMNERAVYYGKWKHGFFSMAAVGATNVGSIRVNFDNELLTNRAGRGWKNGVFFDKEFFGDDTNGLKIKRGDLFGEFNLGSTIVLIFEAPKTFSFNVENGQKINFGQPLGNS